MVDIDNDLIEDDFEIDPTVDDEVEPDQPLRAPPRVQVAAGGERLEQRRFTGGDTLDEPVTATLLRDLQTFKRLVIRTCGWKPANDADDALRREWDLWGPLVMSLSIALLLSTQAAKFQRSQVFTVVFSEIWLGQLLVAANIKLLGGSIAALQALCITGYSLLPIVISAGLGLVIKWRPARILIAFPLAAWAIFVARRGLGFSGVPTRRTGLAVYPVALFYISIAWMCIV